MFLPVPRLRELAEGLSAARQLRPFSGDSFSPNVSEQEFESTDSNGRGGGRLDKQAEQSPFSPQGHLG